MGPYRVDVDNFRSDDRDRILAEIYAMTEQRFTVCRHLLDTRPWDFFMLVEIGLDRLHHAFWRFMDPAHPRYEPGHRYSDVIRSYYAYLDEEIGELLERFDDDTAVIVVSDHGARPMEGAICVNEWLQQEGYLVLREQPDGPIAVPRRRRGLEPDPRLGRGRLLLPAVPQRRGPRARGRSCDPADVRSCCATSWQSGSRRCPGPTAGRSARAPSGPRSSGGEQRGIPPDLVVYFGDLGWRSNGSVGHGRHWTFDNDTGPDDANHDRDGMFVLAGPGVPAERRDDLMIYDVAPTILGLAGLPPDAGMRGRALRTEDVPEMKGVT